MKVMYTTPQVVHANDAGLPPRPPKAVPIEVPDDLIALALVYPEIDWNEVMRKAVRSYTEPCNMEAV